MRFLIALALVGCASQPPPVSHSPWPERPFCVIDGDQDLVDQVAYASAEWGYPQPVYNSHVEGCLPVVRTAVTGTWCSFGRPTMVGLAEVRHFDVWHEVGHAVGAEHSDYPESVMSDPGDISRARYVLPEDSERALLRRQGRLASVCK